MYQRRFEFGANWESYSRTALSSIRINQARADLEQLYDGISLKGKKFLDLGFGQGLTLCLAATLGAIPRGLDIDPQCARALEETRRHFPGISPSDVVIGSILDASVLQQLSHDGQYDVVHAWGSLHHTGAMWRAIDHAAMLVKPDGVLMVAIYQRHWTSPLWRIVKWSYNSGGTIVKGLLLRMLYWPLYFAAWIATGVHPKSSRRGMDFFHDVVDWIGGYPYEYASEREVVSFLESRGFRHLRTQHAKVPTGNNEMLFKRESASS